MTVFPQDFFERDGRFRDLLPADFVPIIYLTEDGSRLCAPCLNAPPAGTDPRATEDPAWRVVEAVLHYEGPDESCDHCSRAIEALYGDPASP